MIFCNTKTPQPTGLEPQILLRLVTRIVGESGPRRTTEKRAKPSIDLVIHKAFTARVRYFNERSRERAYPEKLYGIQGSNEGKIIIFGGGFQTRRKGVVIGAIGTSG